MTTMRELIKTALEKRRQEAEKLAEAVEQHTSRRDEDDVADA